ncbi:hypothetical protein GcC1_207046, partial [Golovinomyces cichoracearum]
NSDQPKSILSKHNYHSKATLTSRDIYNLKAAWNAQKLEGNSKLMALLKDLEKEGFYYRIKKEGEEDSDDEEIIQNYEKRPVYELALRTHGRLLVAFAIPAPLTIVTDKEDALLNSLNRYFPSSTHLLCRWHVNKKIVKNTRDDRSNVRKNRRHELWIKFWDLWEAILNSKSQEEYEENVQNLRACKVREEAIRYCESWLLYKEKLVICQCVFLLLGQPI